MKKLIDFITWITLFSIFSSCVSTHKAEDVLNKNPSEAARYCAEKYPFKDSVGQPEPVRPAKNDNFQGKIDSLFELAAQLANKNYQDSVANANRIAQNLPLDTVKLAQAVVFYRSKANALADQIFALQAKYKPCKPDTVIVPRYRENTARTDAALFQIRDLEKQLAVEKAKSAEFEAKARKRGLIMWLLVAGIGVGIYLRIKGIL